MIPGESTLRMWLAEETPLAIKVATAAKLPKDGTAVHIVWLPRSLITYLRKLPPAAPDEWAPINFTLPDWKITQQGLWKHSED